MAEVRNSNARLFLNSRLLTALADEHRDAWISRQEALAFAEGLGAEQPSDCDSIDPFAGIAPEELTPPELDRAVSHAERRAYGAGL